jgi:UDP-N-acetylglucosamine--N-acetylmuramyl-(pentapeptide) pyrophosphoryl-undecaprenol N-acetylglucosamine transferase
MKTIVLTGGGSSGHVTPNIALIPGLKRAGFSIHYIGSRNGIEKALIEKEGIPYHSINTGKLRRYFDMKNLTDIFRVLDGFREALAVLGKIKPSIVFSKGGFVSCPVVWAAWMRKIPVVIHESDITPGLTNKLSMPFARRICYTFPESKPHIPADKGVRTGMPIREGLLEGNREQGRKICGFSDSKPVILVIGGSLGSEKINNTVRSILDVLLKNFNICHICGKNNLSPELEGKPGYKQFEYINEEQPHIFALSDIAVSRAGATVLFELLALKKPSLLIPLSRAASRGDQIMNAQSFEKEGYSMVLMEESLSAETLLKAIRDLSETTVKYQTAMKQNAPDSGVSAVIRVIEQELKK